jgi:hypothetical protein
VETGKTGVLRAALVPSRETVAGRVQRRTIAWTTLGSGLLVTALATGYYFYNENEKTGARANLTTVLANQEQGSNRECDPMTEIDRELCRAKLAVAQDRVSTANTRGHIGLSAVAVGAAAAVVGAVLLWTAPANADRDDRAVSATPAPFAVIGASHFAVGVVGRF